MSLNSILYLSSFATSLLKILLNLYIYFFSGGKKKKVQKKDTGKDEEDAPLFKLEGKQYHDVSVVNKENKSF